MDPARDSEGDGVVGGVLVGGGAGDGVVLEHVGGGAEEALVSGVQVEGDVGQGASLGG